jgi:mannosyltransferase
VLGGLVVLAAALRLATLGLQSYWFDEANTADIAAAPRLGDVLHRVRVEEFCPPLYYLVAWTWGKLAGTGDVALRLLSATFGVASVPVAWALGRKLVSSRVGLIAAALTATSPLLLYYSQENRPYALLILLSALSLLLLLRALEQPSAWRLAGWGAVCVAAVGTHYFAAFVVVGEVAVLAVRLPDRRRAAAAVAPVLVASGAILLLALDQNKGRKPDYITGIPFHIRLEDTAHEFAKGFAKGVTFSPAAGLGALAVALICSGLVLLLWRTDRSERRAAALPLAIGAAALVLPVVVKVVSTDAVYFRNLIGAWIPLVVGLAVGFGARRAGRVGIGLAVTLCAVWVAIGIALEANERYHRDDWEGLSRLMGPAREDRAVLLVPDWSRVAFHRYGQFTSGLVVPGRRVRELLTVVNWTVVNSATSKPAPPRMGRFRLVQSERVQGLLLWRYRSPVALTPAIPSVSSGRILLFQPAGWASPPH